jgi:hypothetical protein
MSDRATEHLIRALDARLDTPVPVVPHPVTGEALSLDAPTADLARALDELKELESRIDEVRAVIGEEVIRRLDSKARWTAHEGGFKLTAPSPAPKAEWDGPALALALVELRGLDLIDYEAAEAALETVVSYKPKAAGLNRLLKLGGEVAERVGACRVMVEPVRRVSVKRERG